MNIITKEQLSTHLLKAVFSELYAEWRMRILPNDGQPDLFDDYVFSNRERLGALLYEYVGE